MIVFLGWVWAWWCDPSEMMRQRRQRLALEGTRHVTRMVSKRVRKQNAWECTCSCGWQRFSFWTDAQKVRELLDEHEKEGARKSLTMG